jgi:sulfur carrier protein
MNLIINGKLAESYAANVKELLEELRFLPGGVAVEVNLSVVKRADYASCRLHEGDRVEIVNFVGGG